MSRPVAVKIPPHQWNILETTIMLDAESSAFDRELRQALKNAVESIEFVKFNFNDKDGWTLVMPKDAWDLILETLTMDMNSKWFDKNTRSRIRKALEQAEVGELIGPKDWAP